eukprot:2611395-Amphidinium_carterae.5
MRKNCSSSAQLRYRTHAYVIEKCSLLRLNLCFLLKVVALELVGVRNYPKQCLRQKMNKATASDLAKAKSKILSNHDLVASVGASDMSEVRAEMGKASQSAQEGVWTEHSMFRGQTMQSILGPVEADDADEDDDAKESPNAKDKEETPNKTPNVHWDREIALSRARRAFEEDIETTQQVLSSAISAVTEVSAELLRQPQIIQTKLSTELEILKARAEILSRCLTDTPADFQAVIKDPILAKALV